MEGIRSILIFLFASLGSSQPLYSQTSSGVFESLNWTEIRPAAIQTETVMADEPAGRPIINPELKEVWITGRQYLWQWNLDDGAMSRWDQPAGKFESFKLIHATKNILIGIDSRAAWMLNLKQKTWLKLDGSFPPNCLPTSAYPLPSDESHRIYFANKCGIFLILTDPGQLVATSGSEWKLSPDNPQTFSEGPGSNRILTARDKSLLQVTLDGPRLSDRIVYNAKSRIKGTARSGDQILAWTAQAMIVFDEKLRRRQVIPVLGTRKIQALGASATTHIVAFTDGTLEVMNIPSHRKWASSRSDYLAQFIDILANDSLVVLSSESGMPRVFSLPAGNGVTPPR